MSTTAADALVAERNARLSADRSIETRIRDAFREPHPFARKSTIYKPYPVPWLSVYAKRTLSTFGVLAPLAVVVFGWPFAAKDMINLSNQVYNSPQAVLHEPVKSHKIMRRAMLQEGPIQLQS